MNSDDTTWTGQKKKAINGCNQISEKAYSENPLSDSNRPAARLDGNRYLGFSLHSKAHTKHMAELQGIHHDLSKRTRKVSSNLLEIIEIRHRSFGILSSPMDQWYVWKKHEAKRTLCLQLSLVMLRGCFASSGTTGRQDGFTEASGNPSSKHHAIREEADAWWVNMIVCSLKNPKYCGKMSNIYKYINEVHWRN